MKKAYVPFLLSLSVFLILLTVACSPDQSSVNEVSTLVPFPTENANELELDVPVVGSFDDNTDVDASDEVAISTTLPEPADTNDVVFDETEADGFQDVTIPDEPVPGEVFVTFSETANDTERLAYLEQFEGASVRYITDTTVVIVADGISAETLPESSILASTEPVHYLAALQDTSIEPDDPYYPEQWALDYLNLPETWATMPDDAETVKVAVIDSGVCANHPDLAGRILPGYDFVENDSVPQDDYSHGCGIAGIIAANSNNGIGITGAAPNAVILPYRVLDENGVGTYALVAEAIYRAIEDGATIINLSLGGRAYSSVLETAVNDAVATGITIVSATGNNGNGSSALYPAAFSNVIAVGALNPDGSVASYSNDGAEAYAPGTNITTLSPDGGTVTRSGTSFAAGYYTATIGIGSMPVDIESTAPTPVVEITDSSENDTVHATALLSGVTPFSQNDARWRSNRIGNGNSNCSSTLGSVNYVGGVGCAVTSVAMVLTYYGVDTDPGRLNTWLGNNSGFSGCAIYWDKARSYASTQQVNLGLIMRPATNLGTALNNAKNYLDSGYPVILGFNYGTNGSHWLVLTGYQGSTFHYIDSGNASAGTTNWSNSQFGNYSNVRGAILKVYTGTPRPINSTNTTRFFFGDGTLGWQPISDMGPFRENSRGVISTITGNDPWMQSSPVSINGSRYRYVAIQMRTEATNRFQFYWETANGTFAAPGHRANYPLNASDPAVQTDYSQQYYIIDLHDPRFVDANGNPTWDGQTITKLRLDPSVGTVDSGDRVWIHSIQLLRNLDSFWWSRRAMPNRETNYTGTMPGAAAGYYNHRWSFTVDDNYFYRIILEPDSSNDLTYSIQIRTEDGIHVASTTSDANGNIVLNPYLTSGRYQILVTHRSGTGTYRIRFARGYATALNSTDWNLAAEQSTFNWFGAGNRYVSGEMTSSGWNIITQNRDGHLMSPPLNFNAGNYRYLAVTMTVTNPPGSTCNRSRLFWNPDRTLGFSGERYVDANFTAGERITVYFEPGAAGGGRGATWSDRVGRLRIDLLECSRQESGNVLIEHIWLTNTIEEPPPPEPEVVPVGFWEQLQEFLQEQLQNIRYIFTLTNDLTIPELINSLDLSESPECLLPPITSDVTIIGDGATITGTGIPGQSLFCVAEGGSLTLEDLTITGVNSTDPGAVIFNQGTVTLSNVRITGNTTTSDGAVVYNEGDLLIEYSVLTDNVARGRGSTVYNRANATIVDSCLVGNSGVSVFNEVIDNTIDATGNFWGTVDGPAPFGSGDAINVGIDFSYYQTDCRLDPSLNPTPTPEVTPEITPEVTPEITPEVTPEITPEVTPEITPEVTPEITPEVTPEITPEVTPEITPEVTPEITPEVTPEVTPEATEPPFVTEEWHDTDGDGFADSEDACVWQGNEGGLGVDETGCPYYDADWDGFYDRDDDCPWQGDEGGLGVDETGCPYYDADWDGFTDREDACPWRADEYGLGVDDTGCPLENSSTEEPSATEDWSDPDYDGDGFVNANDDCPWQGDEGGLGVDETGCPYYDADWDGFVDRDDNCPWLGNEGGLGVDETGCPYYDADWDGIYDRDDDCIYRGNEYGLGVDETGCPIEANWDDNGNATEEPGVTQEARN